MKKHMLLGILVALALMTQLDPVLTRDAASQGGELIVSGHRLTIESGTFGQSRTVLLSLPPRYAEDEKRYPVIYISDASESRLVLLRGIVDFLVELNLMPDAILVGIVHADRGSELAPPGLQVDDPAGGASERRWPDDRFLQFMKQELFPFIEARYRTLPSRIYVGHSRGGVYGLYCLLREPQMFNAQIAIDPSLWWQDGVLIEALQPFLKRRPDLEYTLLLSESEEMQRENGAYFDRFNDVLRQKTNLLFRYEFLRLPYGESHGSAILPTLYTGLQKIFAEFAAANSPEITFAAFKARFARPILGGIYAPTEAQINSFGYRKLKLEQYDQAIAAFRENVQNHPESPNAFDSLGEAYLRAGRLPEALASFEEAVEVGKRRNDGRLWVYISHRDYVRTLLNRKE